MKLIARRRFRSSSKALLMNRLSAYLLYFAVAFVVVLIGSFIWFSRDLPTPGKLISAQEDQSTRFFDRKGSLIYSVYSKQNRVYVNLSDIPKDLQHATIAVEDKNFYNNQGFSLTGYLRAIRDIILLRGVSGGSTLTQQLVKNTLLTSERSVTRKIKELILSIQVNSRYSKDQIIEMYLNDVSYGGANVGVEAAAQTFFGKHVKDLDLAQSALIAGLPQSPTAYSPFSSKKYYIDRSDEVLTQMVSDNYISQKQKDDALKEIKSMQFDPSKADTFSKAPHFIEYIKQQLMDQFHLTLDMIEKGGFQVTTTLDYSLQEYAQKVVSDEITTLKDKQHLNIHNGAAVVTNPKTGEILAMVGNKDYNDPNPDEGQKINYAIGQDPRQPGSVLKPIIYATAFNKGYTPASMIMDVQTDFPDPTKPSGAYTPVNYDGKFHGPVQVRFALANSYNIPAVKMQAKVGTRDVMQQGFLMGIKSWEPTQANMNNVGLSLALGGQQTNLLDVVTAYGVFATGGQKYDPVSILSVKDSKGNVIYNWKQSQGVQVLSQDVCFLISHILLDNNARKDAFGEYSALVVSGKTVSVKTGTTNDKKDNWTVGYTPSVVVGVWVGNKDRTPMSPAIASGITGASPIWNKIISFALKDKPDEQPVKPDNVDAYTIDAVSGGTPMDGQPTRSEYFIKGTQPTGPGAIYQKLKLSKHQQGKLANQAEIDAHDYDTKDFIVFHEDDPVSTDGKNRWQDGINNWLKVTHSAAEPQYYPPTDTSDYKEPTPGADTPTPTPSSVVTPTPIVTP